MRHVAASRIGVALALAAALFAAALVRAGSGGATFPGREGRIVFADARTDQPGEGNSQVFELDLASGESRNVGSRLSEDSDAVVSPDGTRIAFVRDGRLWLMDRTGGGQHQLVDVAVAEEHPGYAVRQLALAWSPDGSRIAFTGGSAHSLWVVGADGNRLHELTTFDCGRARWSPDGSELAFAGFENNQVGTNKAVIGADGAGLRWLPVLPELLRIDTSWSPPAWSPDGKQLAFDRLADVVVANADGSGEHVLTSNAVSPEWLPGDLIGAIGFNGSKSTVELIHPDGVLRDTVVIGNLASEVAWSPSGDHFAFVRTGVNGARGRQLVVAEPVNGSERVFDLPGFLGNGYTDWTDGPAWSPDAQSLFYAGVVEPRDSELFSITPQGGDLRQLTRDSLDDISPAWSPDGRRIAFTQLLIDSPAYASSLWVMDADGSHLRRLTKPGGQVDPAPSWSPDNHRIAFVRNHPRLEIAVLDTRTGRVRTLVRDAIDPAWSPDGRLIAFVIAAEIRTIRPDGSGERTLFTSPPVRGLPVTFLQRPSWSPDGRSIAVTRLAYGKLTPVYQDQLIVSRASGKARALPCNPPTTPPPSVGTQPATAGYTDRTVWSPDGTALAGSTGDAIWTCTLDGSSANWLAAGFEPDWQPLH